ncbi:hypothetical protein LCGC14_1921310 [marine sediment metagenome]|uniref:IraD/Gp25-like domain-containing protein n=1 Tax=marine sediment metagenome TaxID=412755 RepID=A0A0F9FRJ8_9ZZZZ
MVLYKGFSSFEFQSKGTFRLNDIELVKLDLLNHIFTRRGERVMEPDFGTSIPDLPFEPLTDELVEIVEDELTIVFEFDPRVELLDLRVVPEEDQNALTASALLRFIEFQVTDTLNIRIDLGA